MRSCDNILTQLALWGVGLVNPVSCHISMDTHDALVSPHLYRTGLKKHERE